MSSHVSDHGEDWEIGDGKLWERRQAKEVDQLACEPGRVETLGLRHQPGQSHSVPVKFINDL